MALAEIAAVDGIELMDAAEQAVSADAPTVTDAMDVSEIHGADEERKSTYGLAARLGRRKADEPHAE